MLTRLVFAILLLAPACALSQSSPDTLESPQSFVCNTGYTPEQCSRQVAVLRQMLSRYPAQRLGQWTWVLVRSDDWKPLKNRLRLDPDSPAFSYLPGRQTFIEEALLTPVPARSAELIRLWEMSNEDLLELAVTHELGHGLCGEQDERKADRYGKLLRSHLQLTCAR